MKRTVCLIALFCLFVWTLTASPFAYAESKSAEEMDEAIGEQVGKYIDSLDLGDFENFLNDLDAPDDWKNLSIRELISGVVNGNFSLSFDTFFAFFGQKALGALYDVLAALLTVTILAVMSSILSGLTSGFVKKQTIEIVHYVFYALVVSIVMVKVAELVNECRELIESLGKITEGVFPPLITLMSALGGSVSSSLYKPQLAIFCAVITRIMKSVILPLFAACISFCLIGNLSSSIKMDKIQSAIRYLSTFIVTAVFGLFITYLTVAGISGGMVDGVSIKAAKFVLSSYVPILGGYLSQGFDLISAGCVLVKNAIGVIGIVAIVFTVMRPILHVVVFTFALKVVASLVQPLGDKRISDFLYSVSNSTKILVTAILGTGFVFIISLLLIVVTCNAGVL